MISSWAIVVTGPEMVEEVRTASDDQLSFNHAIADVCGEFTARSEWFSDHMTWHSESTDRLYHGTWHSPWPLSCSLCASVAHTSPRRPYPWYARWDYYSLCRTCPSDERWAIGSLYVPFIHEIVKNGPEFRHGSPERSLCSGLSTGSLSVFLCVSWPFRQLLAKAEWLSGRDPDYKSLNDQYSNALFISAFIINLTPDFLKPWELLSSICDCVIPLNGIDRIVARSLFFYVPAALKRGLKQIGPLVAERLGKEKQFGTNWPGKPVSLIGIFLLSASHFLHRMTLLLGW